MRLLYVLPRYGEGVSGEAARYCRALAERLVERGHTVEVLTTGAAEPDWHNTFAPGVTVLNGVTIRRFPVARSGGPDTVARLEARLVDRPRLAPIELQQEWMRLLGPVAPGVPTWLLRNAAGYDCVIFGTARCWTTWAGIGVTAGAVPTLVQPLTLDDPVLQLSLFDQTFRLPDAFAYAAPEEGDLVARRYPGARSGQVVGFGVAIERRPRSSLFRRQARPASGPYILCSEPVDSSIRTTLANEFAAHKDRAPNDLSLVFFGATEFDAKARESAIAGAVAIVVPAPVEPTSTVVAETFALHRPALVPAQCPVSAGLAVRSGAALPYSGWLEFGAALDMLAERPQVADELGARGRAYVEREHGWDTVLGRYERLLADTVRSTSDAVA